MISAFKELYEASSENLFEEKVLLVPSHSEGISVLRAVAKEGYSLFNIKHLTVFEFAKELIRNNLQEKEIISAPKSRQIIFTILQKLQEEDELKYFSRLKPTISISSKLYNAIYELRMAEIDINNLNLVSSAKEEDIARIFHDYASYLEKNNWLDEPSVFYWAKEWINSTPSNITHPIYLINTDFYNELTHLEKELLNSLAEGSLSFLTDPLEDGKNQQKHQAQNVDFCKADGERAEVKWIFSKIKKEELYFDRVTVLYTSSSPYVELFYQLRENYNLPCTFGEGISIYNTRPGKLSYMLINWLRSDFQVLEFAKILSENLLNIYPEELSPAKVRRMLREAGVGWSRERYLDMIETKIASLNEEDQDSNYVKEKLNSYRALYQWFEELLSLVPAFETDGDGVTQKVQLSELALGLKELIDDYAKVASPTDKEAKEKMFEYLDIIISVGENYSELGDGLDLIEENISNLRVNRESPEPGHIHIDHYLNGRYKLRDHLFLVGLDGDRYPGKKTEDPVLLDEERKNLSAELPLQKQVTDKNQLEMQRILQGVWDSLDISYSSFDTIEHREKFPSPLILSIYREVFDEPWADYSRLEKYLNSEKKKDPSPQEENEVFAAEDLWLYLYRLSQSIDDNSTMLRKDNLFYYYPHWERGLKAELERLSESFTPYEGNVSGLQEISAPDADQESDESSLGMQEIRISPTRLEFLAKCPFAYFLRHVLKIEPPEEVEFDPTTWLDALTRGQLLHRIFEDFYREIIDRSELPVKETHLDELNKVARKRIEAQKEEIPPPSELVYSYESTELLDSVQVFLQSEIEHAESSQPVLLEFYLDKVPLILPSGKKIYINGKIDRVDKDTTGNYLALDYKTGSTYIYTEQRYYRGGRQLQHALYALALEEKFKELYPDQDIEVSGGGYVFPTVKGEGERYIRYYYLKDKEEFLELLDNLLAIIESGNYIMTDHEKDCKFCDYHLVCERTRYKDVLASIHQNEPELEPLRQVREYE